MVTNNYFWRYRNALMNFLSYIYIYIYIERERERDKQTDRKTDGQT